MAIALLVTFEVTNDSATAIGISSQVLTFVDKGAAEKALVELKAKHMDSTVNIRGTILKDVII